ncbi:MAG TPA: hypothetical protein VM915_12925 [Verrucomicrobiae bacterium]|nr:hypothetical protein [Verrucomicrobiae bacterium]
MQIARRNFALATIAAALVATPARADVGDLLNGMWEGSLTLLSGPELTSETAWRPFRISIDRDTTRVFLRAENSTQFEEIKPGAFRIRRLGNSAVLSALDASPRTPVGQSWVESWTFSLTLKAENTLTCIFVRQVNNHQVPRGQDEANFAMVLTGELQRVSLDHV